MRKGKEEESKAPVRAERMRPEWAGKVLLTATRRKIQKTRRVRLKRRDEGERNLGRRQRTMERRKEDQRSS